VVSIAEPEEIPLSPTTDDSLPRPKQFPAGVSSRRMTGRPNLPSGSSSRASLVSLASLDDYNASTDTSAQGNKSEEKLSHGHAHRHKQEHHVHQHDKLLLQVSEWLQREKAKRAAKKSKRGSKGRDLHVDREESESGSSSRPRTSSQGSDASAISLERLQRILEDNMSGFGHEALPMHPEPRRPSLAGPRRKSSVRRSRGSSDTEYQDGDVVVPSCDVVLDNSKTLSYSGGHESSDTTVTLSTSKRAEKERKAWLVFKSEIVKLAHTLRLKGWRRVPLENGGDIEVERLSGALTNAVYVVSPPLTIPTNPAGHAYKAPPKLLLRIYGPQVEHLIDRENELGILRRLARKKIGPRLLGTFTNGRFEEFFNATTLTAADLRVEGTSKQIAKRMRELHDGIDLLESEREEGPFVWQNWEKWVGRCAEVVEYLDAEILRGVEGGSGKGREPWRARGLVCGVEWKVFKAAVSGFKKWLEEYYRAKGGVARNLVFAHNDVSPLPPLFPHLPIIYNN
jgi:choline kinase